MNPASGHTFSCLGHTAAKLPHVCFLPSATHRLKSARLSEPTGAEKPKCTHTHKIGLSMYGDLPKIVVSTGFPCGLLPGISTAAVDVPTLGRQPSGPFDFSSVKRAGDSSPGQGQLSSCWWLCLPSANANTTWWLIDPLVAYKPFAQPSDADAPKAVGSL